MTDTTSFSLSPTHYSPEELAYFLQTKLFETRYEMIAVVSDVSERFGVVTMWAYDCMRLKLDAEMARMEGNIAQYKERYKQLAKKIREGFIEDGLPEEVANCQARWLLS